MEDDESTEFAFGFDDGRGHLCADFDETEGWVVNVRASDQDDFFFALGVFLDFLPEVARAR